MKKIFTIIFIFMSILLIHHGSSYSQVPNNQDCLGAIPLCQQTYSTTTSYTGTGNYTGEIPTTGGCPGNCLLAGEKNDVWYIFTVSASGLLDFRITPNSSGDDYDWAVYNLTNYDCSDIYNNNSLVQVSCNYAVADPANNGITGAHTPTGTTNCEGASSQLWNLSIPVTTGEIYVLNVSNYSSSQYGYTIDFSNTTASIIDNIPPTIQSVTQPIPCGATTITLTFSENVLCSSVDVGDFVLTGPGGPYTISNIVGVGAGCTGTPGYGLDFQLTINPGITNSGSYSVGLSPTGSITDICGNVATVSLFNFTIVGVVSTINGSTNPTCLTGNDGSIVSSASGGTPPYTYSLNGGTPQASGTFNGLGPGTYTVTAIDNFGCTNTSSSVTLSSPSTLLAGSVSADQSVCSSGDPALLISVADASGGSGTVSYQWEYTSVPGCASGWTTIPGATSTTYDPPTGLTTTTCYRRVATDICGVVYSNTITVSITAPVANAGTDATICPGTSTPLNASGGISYSWSPATGLSATNIANPTASPIISTNYIVTITDGSGCTASDNVVITVQGAAPAYAGLDITICPGGNTTLSASGGTTYSWSPATGLSATNIPNPIASPLTTTTYIVTVTDGSGCTGTDNVVITIGNPAPANAGADVNICLGGSTTLNASGGVSYSWSPASTLSNPSIPNPVATPTSVTTYIVTVTNAVGCTGTDDVVVTIGGSAPANAGADVNICQGTSTTLNASGGITYSWSPSSTLNDPFISNPVATPTSPTTYVVTVTDANGCSGTDDVIVGFSPPLLPVITPSGQTGFCDSASVNVTLDAGSGYLSYYWSTTEVTQTIVVTQPGTYTVSVVDASGCSGSSGGITVYVQPPMNIPVILAASASTFCGGDSVNLYLIDPYYTYEWSSGSNTPSIWVYETNDYIVTVTDSIGCVGISNLYHVQVNPLPVAYASYSNQLLDVSFFDFSMNATSWSWDFGDGQSSALSDPTHTYDSSNVYIVVLTASNNCGSDSDTLYITLPGPAGIENYNDLLSDLLIYPIPAHHYVYISFYLYTSSDFELSVEDILGQKIFSENISNYKGQYTKNINLANYARGIYLLNIRSNDFIIIRKFNKE